MPAIELPPRYRGPLLTYEVCTAIANAARAGSAAIECSLDLQRTQTQVTVSRDAWEWDGARYPYLDKFKERTVYYWNGEAFHSVSRYSGALIKLVPTSWGPPTFEIDGIKMLPSEHVSPFEDAKRKVDLIQPRGKSILDTCGGLGYFASWCLSGGAASLRSYEKNPDVFWLRSLNPWSPESALHANLDIECADVSIAIETLPEQSFEALLHDPPRFGIAGELYSQRFYDQLARVLKPGGKLFHYTGTPNKLTSGRDVPAEVATRLQRAGFAPKMELDGVLAVKRRR